ncbi:NAD(P)-dependent dehydrogenase, short-chain alcohol dehydrogenase family [Franzmannia pantelleriensis]|uniref:NAD(P)-dependent dehydrogenase, short-chain alcohol dehydrogenase family n=1 Tax=Franzmannia pantelleriensis TaxID=48727 RepID=A0A1G9JL88_9GAMM|nr:SDR family NAD(P)-dependent oxidoreductase [Halomonas pantelleriensis]SDL38278.1 NAD(P)-dependent dehydrogenase, short-chain alcohol dehydrogenase family [Halomonas pantelleriensis]
MFPTLPERINVLVTGASGGIGQALCRALRDAPQVARLIAVSRHPPALAERDPRGIAEHVQADLTSAEGRATLAEHLDGTPLHLTINTLGMLHDANAGITPEKRLEDLDPAALNRLFEVNAATPALLLQVLLPSLKGRHPTYFASLSARVGSLGDNHLGGWYAYRASKAAHNMLLRTAAVELKRLNRQACVLCLHPGTTDTALSQPFQARVPDGKLFTPAFVAERLLDVIAQRRPEDSGSFWDWAGEPIPW